MSDREISLLLQDVKVAILSIFSYTEGFTLDIFEKDIKTSHAVERNFEIIGEAASRIPIEYKEHIQILNGAY
jgi:uncharacterized protein with HEPN domain